jgi:hypothetical protein
MNEEKFMINYLFINIILFPDIRWQMAVGGQYQTVQLGSSKSFTFAPPQKYTTGLLIFQFVKVLGI